MNAKKSKAARDGSARDGRSAPRTPRARRRMAGVVAAAVLTLAACAAGVLFALGVFPVSRVAATYDSGGVIYEDEVTDYINVYREHTSGTGGDQAWAEALAQSGQTPESLRDKTIRQLVIDAKVAERAAELNLSVSEEEIDSYIGEMKGAFAFDDDKIWAETLQQYGQTEAGARDTYRLSLLREKVFDAQVETPVPTDDELFAYLKATYPNGVSAKHIYYLSMKDDDVEGGYEGLKAAQTVRNALADGGVDADEFGAFVEVYCDDDELKKRAGANGWSLDMDDYSQNYQNAVEETKVGEVSKVFSTDDGYGFVWIDERYKLPGGLGEGDAAREKTLAALPETLRSYFSDRAAQALRQAACQDYLAKLYDESGTVATPMPADVPYNVDMPVQE